MFVIGLLLLAAAVAVGIAVGVQNDADIDVEAFNQVWTTTPAITFLVGIATGVVGLLGLWLMIHGLRRMRVKRREQRAIHEERDRLASEREREIAAMSAAGRGDGDDRSMVRDDDDRDRDTVRDPDRETIDLREGQREGEQVDEREGARHGLFHRSDH